MPYQPSCRTQSRSGKLHAVSDQPSPQARAPENRHVRTLERRLAHLDARLQKMAGEGPPKPTATWDAQEADALRVALRTMGLYRAEQQGNEYSTSFLLEEAREALDKGMTTLERSELVRRLRERARLLEDLG